MRRYVFWLTLVSATATAIFVGSSAATAAAVEDNMNSYDSGPMLLEWNSYNYLWRGVSAPDWEDSSTSFLNNGTTYNDVIGMRTGQWGGFKSGIATYWLDGRYTSLNATAFMDDRTSSPTAKAEIWVDGTQVGDSTYFGANGSRSFSGIDLTGADWLELRVTPDSWGGRPYQYLFWQTDLTPVENNVPHHYADTLTAATSAALPENNAVVYDSAGGTFGTTPSIDSWADTAAPLLVDGEAVSGVGLRGRPNNGASTDWASWELIQTHSDGWQYKLFKFAVAPDSDRLGTPNSNNAFLDIYLDGGLLTSIDLNGVTTYRTFYVDGIADGNLISLMLRNPGGGWGGAPAPYFVVTDAQFIAVVPEPASAFLLAGAGLVLLRRRQKGTGGSIEFAAVKNHDRSIVRAIPTSASGLGDYGDRVAGCP